MNYTDEKNAQIVLSFLKHFGVKKIVVSPGTTNIPIVGSVQNDPFFEVYSSVDERSAAYLACGLSQQSGEIVALSCTGATASRNYLSGLTEAYYKKLPIIAITSTNGNYNIGNLSPQNIDRTIIQNDVSKLSVQLPIVENDRDYWYCKHLVNKAFFALNDNGGGPVHINLPTSYLGTFSLEKLPSIRIAEKITIIDVFPNITKYKKIAIFIGSHKKFSEIEIREIEIFCERYNGVVLYDHTSSYSGKSGILSARACKNATSEHAITKELQPDLILHLGEVSGDYSTLSFLENSAAPVWRVSSDGALRDSFKRLDFIFECSELFFFDKFNSNKKTEKDTSYSELWIKYSNMLTEDIQELPFSNLWLSQEFSKVVPQNSVVHFGILNSLRSNNLYNYDSSIETNSNVGGFGIDGCVSTLVGSSLASPEKLNFLVVGDLAFFYDMNVLGNRHLGTNIRILLVNNSGGAEFKNYSHQGASLGEKSNDFVAAAGHFNKKGINSPAQGWVESLGFEYLKASTKEEFNNNLEAFFNTNSDKSIILECFTTFQEESNALKIMDHLDNEITLKGKIKNIAKNYLSRDTKNKIKKIMR